ncbi:MAG: hypothetical protein LH478_08035 [Chitinophagaceae bacterium]|nr:hypothetical protein [Chitinophagaceae bacterium]
MVLVADNAPVCSRVEEIYVGDIELQMVFIEREVFLKKASGELANENIFLNNFLIVF